MERCWSLFLVLVLVLSMVLSFGACAQTPTGGEVIKIGAVLDLTGFIAPPAIDAHQGMLLALEDAGYQVKGKKIELIVEDGASDVDKSLDKARKLVEVDKVHLIIGPIFGAAQETMAGYMDRVKVPILTIAPSSSKIPLNNSWTFLPCGAHQQATYPLGIYAAEVLGYKTATTLASDFVGGHDFIEGFTEGFELKGGKVIQNQWSPPGTKDYIPFYLAAKPADCIATWWAGAEAFAGFAQYKELKIKMPLIQPEDGGITASPIAVKELGDVAIGVVVAAVYSYTADTPGNKEFVQKYQKKYNVLPGPFGGAGYVSAQVAMEGLKNAGGTGRSEDLKQGLLKVSLKNTIRGPISFTADRVAVFQAHILKIDKNLVPQVVAIYNVASNKVGNKMQVSLVK